MVTLLQDREYRQSIALDLIDHNSVRIECLTLTPFIIVLLRDFLIQGGHVEILTNSYSKKQIHGADYLENRKELKNLGAHVFTYEAPHLNHQKVVLIEPDIVYLGSHNMTSQSNFANRESSVRLVNKAIYDKLLAGFWLKTKGKV